MRDDDDLKTKVLDAIADTQDQGMRTVFLLLAKMVDVFDRKMGLIVNKIDAALADEKTLREMVLNGHSATHDDDHRWLRTHMEHHCDEMCAKLVENYRDDARAEERGEASRAEVMAHVRAQIAEGNDRAKNMRRIAWDIVGKALWLGVAFVAGLVFSGRV